MKTLAVLLLLMAGGFSYAQTNQPLCDGAKWFLAIFGG
jgi:hypothetical protein